MLRPVSEWRRQHVLKLLALFCLLSQNGDPRISEKLRRVGDAIILGDNQAFDSIPGLLRGYRAQMLTRYEATSPRWVLLTDLARALLENSDLDAGVFVEVQEMKLHALYNRACASEE